MESRILGKCFVPRANDFIRAFLRHNAGSDALRNARPLVEKTLGAK
jgi:hypothetical protein